MNEPGPPQFGQPVGFDAPPPAPRGPGLRSDSKWQGLKGFFNEGLAFTHEPGMTVLE